MSFFFLNINLPIFFFLFFFFFFNDTATTEIYTLSLHDALPIFVRPNDVPVQRGRDPCVHLRHGFNLLGRHHRTGPMGPWKLIGPAFGLCSRSRDRASSLRGAYSNRSIKPCRLRSVPSAARDIALVDLGSRRPRGLEGKGRCSPSRMMLDNARRQAIAPGPPAPGRPPVALVSAALASPASIPATANTFVRERSPRCSDTRLGVTPRALASARRASSVAAPPTGAAATRITRPRAAISHPGRERGRTRRSTSTPPGIARTTYCLRKVGSLSCRSHLPDRAPPPIFSVPSLVHSNPIDLLLKHARSSNPRGLTRCAVR